MGTLGPFRYKGLLATLRYVLGYASRNVCLPATRTSRLLLFQLKVLFFQLTNFFEGSLHLKFQLGIFTFEEHHLSSLIVKVLTFCCS